MYFSHVKTSTKITHLHGLKLPPLPPPPPQKKTRFLEEHMKKSYTNLSRFYFVIFCYYFF